MYCRVLRIRAFWTLLNAPRPALFKQPCQHAAIAAMLQTFPAPDSVNGARYIIAVSYSVPSPFTVLAFDPEAISFPRNMVYPLVVLRLLSGATGPA
jgi:hypothetical protein